MGLFCVGEGECGCMGHYFGWVGVSGGGLVLLWVGRGGCG